METKEMLRFGNFIVELQTEDENKSALVMRDLGSTWENRINSTNPLFAYWVQMALCDGSDVISDNQKEQVKAAFEATVVMLYQLSNAGLHDVVLTNILADAVDDRNKRIAEIIDKNTDEEKEQKEASAWMEQQQAMEDMQKELEETQGTDDKDIS